MSDKFFFKGRQDARVNHAKAGFNTNAAHKSGTEKFPLALVVTSEKRKKEIEAQLLEHGLFANITLDTTAGAEESIIELTALLNTTGTITVEKTPARNEACLCGSGKKYKKCCG